MACPIRPGPVIVFTDRPDTEAVVMLQADEHDSDLVPATGPSKKLEGSVAVFSKKGKDIYIGNSKGRIIIINSETLKIHSSIQTAQVTVF